MNLFMTFVYRVRVCFCARAGTHTHMCTHTHACAHMLRSEDRLRVLVLFCHVGPGGLTESHPSAHAAISLACKALTVMMQKDLNSRKPVTY